MLVWSASSTRTDDSKGNRSLLVLGRIEHPRCAVLRSGSAWIPPDGIDRASRRGLAHAAAQLPRHNLRRASRPHRTHGWRGEGVPGRDPHRGRLHARLATGMREFAWRSRAVLRELDHVHLRFGRRASGALTTLFAKSPGKSRGRDAARRRRSRALDRLGRDRETRRKLRRHLWTLAAAYQLEVSTEWLAREGTLCLVGALEHPHVSPKVCALIFNRRSVASSRIERHSAYAGDARRPRRAACQDERPRSVELRRAHTRQVRRRPPAGSGS